MTSIIGKLLNRSPVPLSAPVATGGLVGPIRSRNDAVGGMRAYGSVSTLFAVVDRISNAVAQVEWRGYRPQVDQRRTRREGPERREEIVRDPRLALLNKPNPFMSRSDLFEVVEQHMNLTGEGWVVIAKEPVLGVPTELWPVRPDRMRVVPHPTEFIAGYVYTGPNGEQVPLDVNDIIFMRMPNPLDPYRGLGPVQATMIDLDSARASAEWNRNFFHNSAEPGGHLQVPHNLDDKEFEKLTTRWAEQHKGVTNAHRVAVLEGGITWKERMFSQRDMQFSELRGISREIIREAFGIHAHMLGLSENVNKANAFAGEVSFARWIVHPRAQRWKRVLNRFLVPQFTTLTRQPFEFDHDRVVPEDREADDRERQSKALSAQMLVSAGWNPDDVTAAMGLPDMEFTGPVQPNSGPTAPDPEAPTPEDEQAESD